MSRGFFNPESGLWQVLGWIGDLVVLSLLWTVCSAPLLTSGAAAAALYDAVVHGFRRGEPDTLRRFLSTFRRELKSGLLPSLLWTALLLGVFLLFRAALAAGTAAAVSAAVLALLVFGVACWVFPLLSRFTLDFRTLNGNALRLALGHAPATFALGLGGVGSVLLTLRLALLPLFILPALFALYVSLFLEPVFRRYEP